MKKYLFLMFLFFVYLILVSKPKTVATFNVNEYDYSINEFYICFKNGLNSKKMSSILENYDSDYLIKEIFTKDEKISISCSDFKNCEKNIYKMHDNEFEIKKLASGFRIDKILIITDEEKLKKFLILKNISYQVIN